MWATIPTANPHQLQVFLELPPKETHPGNSTYTRTFKKTHPGNVGSAPILLSLIWIHVRESL